MVRKFLLALSMLALVVLGNGYALAAEPTLHEVYQAAEAGRMAEAQTMMRTVLAAHPESAKAHYVEAELLAKEGQMSKAQVELANAERLEPGLPFAKAQAVQELKARLGAAPTAMYGRPAQFPWGMLLVGLGLIAALVWFVRALMTRNAVAGQYPAAPGGYGQYGAGNAGAPYGGPLSPGYGGGPAAWNGAQPGLGSRVMGGLATGAAVGAGVVAGEALMHRVLGDGERHSGRVFDNNSDDGLIGPAGGGFDDMGGNDFGVADTSSWDDSGGGSDWS